MPVIQFLGARARSRSTGDTGDPTNTTGRNTGLRHDLTIAIQRLVHQIVHALGTQFRVHSSEGQAGRTSALIRVTESRQGRYTYTRDVQMQVTFDCGVRT